MNTIKAFNYFYWQVKSYYYYLLLGSTVYSPDSSRDVHDLNTWAPDQLTSLYNELWQGWLVWNLKYFILLDECSDGWSRCKVGRISLSSYLILSHGILSMWGHRLRVVIKIMDTFHVSYSYYPTTTQPSYQSRNYNNKKRTWTVRLDVINDFQQIEKKKNPVVFVVGWQAELSWGDVKITLCRPQLSSQTSWGNGKYFNKLQINLVWPLNGWMDIIPSTNYKLVQPRHNNLPSLASNTWTERGALDQEDKLCLSFATLSISLIACNEVIVLQL